MEKIKITIEFLIPPSMAGWVGQRAGALQDEVNRKEAQIGWGDCEKRAPSPEAVNREAIQAARNRYRGLRGWVSKAHQNKAERILTKDGLFHAVHYLQGIREKDAAAKRKMKRKARALRGQDTP